MSLVDFLAMGGYAAFVWPSLGVTLFALAWNVWAARRMHRKARRDARRRFGIAEGP